MNEFATGDVLPWICLMVMVPLIIWAGWFWYQVLFGNSDWED